MTVADGEHVLTLTGENVSVNVKVATDAIVHEGTLTSDETWTADKLHIVRHAVVIPEGRMLSIADGATVRFCENTGFVNEGEIAWGNGIRLEEVEEENIAAGLFAGVEGIASVTLADSVTAIGDGAFAGCVNLEEIVLSRNLATIGENAFQRCAKLTRLHFPEGAVTVGAGAFSGCTRLQEITCAGSKPNYLGTGRLFPHRGATITAYRDGYGWSADPLYQVNVELAEYPVCGDFTYQVDCKEGAWIRSWNTDASELAIPGELDGHPVWNIRSAALYRKSVVKLTLPATVEQLEERFARECYSLAYVIFAGERPPAMVAGNPLFPDVNPHLLVPETPAWTAANEEGWKYRQEAISYHVDELAYRVEEDSSATVMLYCGSNPALVIPDELGGHTVKAIAAGAFRNNTLIQSVVVSDNVEVIHAEAFSGCANLVSVTMPYNLRRIEDNAFDGCGSIDDLLGYNVEEDESATVIFYLGKHPALAIPPVLGGHPVKAIAEGAFKDNTVIQSVVIPDAVEEVPAYAFSGCANLTSVTLPYKLRRIDESAFNYCGSLAEIHFPGTPEEADEWLDFMPVVALHVFADQGWPEVLDDDGTYFGLDVVIGIDSNLRLELAYDNEELPCEGGEAAFTVDATAAWTAESNADWLVLQVAAGKGDGVVTFTCAPNPANEPRAATISVRLTAAGLSKSIDVVQEPAHYFTDTLEYAIQDGQVVVLDYLVDGDPIVIPATLSDCPVAQVRLTAHELEGRAFDHWTGEGVELANPGRAAIAFAPNGHEVTLTANYNPKPYQVIVDGVAQAWNYGAAVEIAASAREGFRFREWSAVGIELEDAHAAVVRFTMPAHNVILVSAYNTLKTYDFVAGWNIVTPTLVLTEASAQELAGLGALTWNAGVENYIPAQGGFAPGVPLWLFCREAGMLTLEGVPPEAWTLQVARGWSLVGVVREVKRNKWPANLKAVWRWTPRGFEACDGNLEAGQAYWMQGE